MTEEVGSRTPADTKLLLIDEDPSARALASSVLSTLFPVSGIEEVGHSTEFFHALKTDSYDIIVTELGMKWAHWLFLFEAIRALQPNASIVVFTNDDDRESALAALNAGASEYVVKSSRGFLNLTQAVDKVLIGRPQRAVPAPAVQVTPAGAAETPELVFEPEIPPDPEPVVETPSEVETVVAEPAQEETAPVIARTSRSRTALHFDNEDSSVESILDKVRKLVSREAHAPAAMMIGIVGLTAFLTAVLVTLGGNGDRAEGEVLAEQVASGDPVEAVPEQAEAVPEAPESVPLYRGEAPLTLELRSNERVWVRLFMDGKQVINTNLKAGERRVFEGERNADLTVGNAAGLTVFWNGTDIGRLGGPGEPRRLHFWPTRVGRGPLPPSAWR